MTINLSGPTKLPNNNKVEKLVIFLHGYGANGDDLIDLSDSFADLLPNAAFVSPSAPFPCENSYSGFQWFSLANYNEEKLYEGIDKALPILENFINQKLTQFKLEIKDLILMGFSQGTMMALQMAPRLVEACHAVIGFSGALIKADQLEINIRSYPKIFLCHGKDDQVLSYDNLFAAETALKSMKLEVEAHLISSLGHSIDAQTITLARNFLIKISK